MLRLLLAFLESDVFKLLGVNRQVQGEIRGLLQVLLSFACGPGMAIYDEDGSDFQIFQRMVWALTPWGQPWYRGGDWREQLFQLHQWCWQHMRYVGTVQMLI